jgi:hypothetical protein
MMTTDMHQGLYVLLVSRKFVGVLACLYIFRVFIGVLSCLFTGAPSCLRNDIHLFVFLPECM